MTGLYHRDLRRRIERLEEHYRPSPAAEVYQCLKNWVGDILAVWGPRLRWYAERHPPGAKPPPVPSPWHLPPPITVTLITGEAQDDKIETRREKDESSGAGQVETGRLRSEPHASSIGKSSA